MVYFPLWEDVGVMQREWKVAKMPINGESAVTLGWTIHGCMNYVHTHHDPYDLDGQA